MAEEDGPKLDRPSTAAEQATPSVGFAAVNTSPATMSKPGRKSSISPPAISSRATEVSAKQTPLESQPMTATTSTSSQPAENSTKDATDANGASPYGTRSRNRTGSSRPNYAEEPEIMEYEWTSTKKSQPTVEGANSTPQSIVTLEKSSGANTRRSSNVTPMAQTAPVRATAANATSHQIPGMSTFSVNPEPATGAPAPTRKRKAPGATPAASQNPSTLTHSSVSGPTRKLVPSAAYHPTRTTTLMTFERCQGYLKYGKLQADDGTWLAVGDQIYSICEPPGEPYYLARILEFLHTDNDDAKPVIELKVNWYLRPRDCSRKANDTRTVYATFQTAVIDITTLRGKCTVAHRSEVGDLDLYRKKPNAFWYDKLFDRYIHRFYEVIPIAQVINVPEKVKKVLDERWKYVVVEIGRGKELTSAIKSCKRCSGYCASNDSVDCAVCKNTYHMACVKPPLFKKPARGFGWSCGPCSRKQERRLEARNTPNQAGEGEEEEIPDEEEEDHGAASQTGHQKHLTDTSPTEGGHPPTAEQLELTRLWPYRYLGLHCKLEDALDYDDRIYPRASSRLGPKHQANVHVWHGRPVRYVKSKDIKRKYMKGSTHKKDAKLTKETTAALEADKAEKERRPKWVMDEPPGYINRGEDHSNSDPKNTAQLLFRMPSLGEESARGQDNGPSSVTQEDRAVLVDEYMEKAKKLAPLVGVAEYSTNFLDKALELFTANGYQSDKALAQLQNVKKRKDLKEPDLTKEETRRFEEGVAKYGSELRNISRHVGKTQKHGEIVRFYYMWKKTPNGHLIWGNYDGRKGKKAAKQADSKLLDDVADDADDSAFDSTKAAIRKRGFICKFCNRRDSPQWRRAPATQPGTTVPADPSLKSSKDKSAHLILALCDRCGSLWRRLGIQYEDVETVSRKIASSGGRAWKRRIDEELLAELVGVNVSSDISMNKTTADAAASIGVAVPANLTIQEGSKKKQKVAAEPQLSFEPPNGMVIEPIKKKEVEKPVEPPPMIPEEPRVRLLPCAVCYEGEPAGDQLLVCRHCRLTVHRNCYGVPETKSSEKWACDMCVNDLGMSASTIYECTLCTVDANTDTDVALLMEPPRVSHKKKTDREREKERLEKEMVDKRADLYFAEQERRGRPRTPRQPLKRTSGNNWVHVVCAVFHPEIKFSEPQLLEYAEGFAAIPSSKWTAKCKQCKKVQGACVNCSHCQAPVHAACAQQYGFNLLFDLNPVKQSRKDAVNTVDMGGESGNATAAIYCREHAPKHKTHCLNEMDPDSPLNALQKYVRSHKQVDISQTGTQRKALMVQTATKSAALTADTSGTRGATATAANAVNGNTAPPTTTRSSRVSPSTITIQSEEVDEDGDRIVHLSDVKYIDSGASKECSHCGTEASPKFYLIKPRSNHQASQPSQSIELDERTELVSIPPEMSSSDLPNGVHAPLRGQTKLDRSEVTVHAISDENRRWLCHKCHLRKLKNPTPPRVETPPPEPMAIDLPKPEPTSPQVPVPWPSQASISVPPPPLPPAAAPPHEPHHRYSGGPNEPPPYYGPDHVPNGVHHSPVVAPPPPPPPPPPAPHYGQPPPPAPPAYGPPPYPYRADSRERPLAYSRNPNHPHYQAPPGYEPPSFQYRRDPTTGTLIQVPYIPPNRQGQAAPPPPPLRSPPSAHRLRSPHMRSPQVQALPPPPPPSQPPAHARLTPPPRRTRSPMVAEQGPHGPPEADSNPFAVVHSSQPSPRQAYQNGGIYDSPHASHARPETPDYARESRWSSQHRDHGERPTTNGASESPHLRNLLH